MYKAERLDSNNLVLAAVRSLGYTINPVDIERVLNLKVALDSNSNLSITEISEIAKNITELLIEKKNE